MKKLIVDLKDTSAIIVAGENLELESMNCEFGQLDFADPRNKFYNLAGDRFRELCAKSDAVFLVIPMQYSMIKLLEIDNAGLARFGDKFIEWEASQQLPEELGKFRFGFNRLGPSFDQQKVKYLFWAAPENVINGLIDFMGLPANIPIILQSEAMGFFKALNYCTENLGFNAAVAMSPQGASIVISHDGDFIGARFIENGELSLKDEVMYYIMGLGSETLKPQLLYCGDPEYLSMLGAIDWADSIIFEPSMLPNSDSRYCGAFGISLIES
ncbi:MAG: hypothetical protein GX409_12295 [candidate division Zixibacteria bacterium]|nr:hypothetical protein [candidate division Zixibacteria bacterium]